MTRLAFGVKCVPLSGYSGPGADANKPGFNSDPSAAAPMPVAVRAKKCRRVRSKRCSRSGSISILRYGFVEVQDHAGHGGPRRQLHGVNFLGRLPIADRQELFSGGGVARKILLLLFKDLQQRI